MDMHEGIDLSITLEKLNQLQLEEGDLGAAYWLSISKLLKASGEYRDRAIAAERNFGKYVSSATERNDDEQTGSQKSSCTGIN